MPVERRSMCWTRKQKSYISVLLWPLSGGVARVNLLYQWCGFPEADSWMWVQKLGAYSCHAPWKRPERSWRSRRKRAEARVRMQFQGEVSSLSHRPPGMQGIKASPKSLPWAAIKPWILYPYTRWFLTVLGWWRLGSAELNSQISSDPQWKARV